MTRSGSWADAEMELGSEGLGEQGVFCIWEECKLLWPEGNHGRLCFPKIAAPASPILHALLQSDFATHPSKTWRLIFYSDVPWCASILIHCAGLLRILSI